MQRFSSLFQWRQKKRLWLLLVSAAHILASQHDPIHSFINIPPQDTLLSGLDLHRLSVMIAAPSFPPRQPRSGQKYWSIFAPVWCLFSATLNTTANMSRLWYTAQRQAWARGSSLWLGQLWPNFTHRIYRRDRDQTWKIEGTGTENKLKLYVLVSVPWICEIWYGFFWWLKNLHLCEQHTEMRSGI